MAVAKDTHKFVFKCPNCQHEITVTPELLAQLEQDHLDAEKWRAAIDRGSKVFGNTR